jgi:hypothetical protein
VPETHVPETLRTARSEASPRSGFAGIALVSRQRKLVSRTSIDPRQIEEVIIERPPENVEQGTNIGLDVETKSPPGAMGSEQLVNPVRSVSKTEPWSAGELAAVRCASGTRS